MSMNNSDTKTIFVTGAGSGIGLACVRHFLSLGHRVVAHIRSESVELTSLVTEGELEIIRADFSSKEDIESLAQSDIWSRVDVLVNNAGTYCYRDELSAIELDDVENLFRVNYVAPLMLIKAVTPFMVSKKWGRIVNVSSVSVSHGGAARTVDYTSSKAAIESMTQTLAKSLTKENVLVNAVRVGFTDTKFNDLNPGKNLDARLKYIPLGRAASPDEIAKVVGFLASSEANYMAGSIVPVTGGEK